MAMPRVEPAPSSQICSAVNGVPAAVLVPQMPMNAPKTAIDTTLFTIGAHIIGPKTSRALSTWPIRKKTP